MASGDIVLKFTGMPVSTTGSNVGTTQYTLQGGTTTNVPPGSPSDIVANIGANAYTLQFNFTSQTTPVNVMDPTATYTMTITQD